MQKCTEKTLKNITFRAGKLARLECNLVPHTRISIVKLFFFRDRKRRNFVHYVVATATMQASYNLLLKMALTLMISSCRVFQSFF